MAKSRSKNKDNARRAKKKTSILTTDSVHYVDWKDVNLLRRFMSERSKVRARRVTGNDAQQQKEVARAIKNAREMALLPYVTRITQQRGPRGDRAERGSGGERPGRGDREERTETGADEDAAVDAAEDEALAVTAADHEPADVGGNDGEESR
jgi:small subunit ribosomal protein S18